MTETPGKAQTEAEHAQLVRDLERRIDALDRANESDFGEFTHVDWILCIVGFVVFPYLLYLWFWP